MKLYQKLASTIAAIENCRKSCNAEWMVKHEATLADLMAHMPSGSGFDCGTKLDETSTFEKIIFNTAYHHMDEHGGYDGWTEHTVTVTSSLIFGFTTKISGKDRNGIKEYIGEVFESILSNETA